MSTFWHIVIISVLIGFNFYSFDMMMRMRSDIRVIRKHLLGDKASSSNDSSTDKDGVAGTSIAVTASKTFNKIISDIKK
jgi:hypothetical protein